MNANHDWLPGAPPASGAGKYLNPRDLKEYDKRTVDVRVLCPFVNFYEGWVNKKPVRSATIDGFPEGTVFDEYKGKKGEAKSAWATAVYNHTKKRIMVFSFSQGTIYGQIKALVENKKWGPLSGYDLTISSEGEDKETVYKVIPNPHDALPASVLKEWEDLQGRWTGLGALLNGGDPFADFSESVPF